MNYLIRDKISCKQMCFWSDASQEIVSWISKVNQNRPDMIAKRDRGEINHVLDFVPYHLKRAGYRVEPLHSKIIHSRILVESFMTKDVDLMKYTVARDLTGLYKLDGLGIKVGNGKVVYDSFDWSPGKKRVKLIRVYYKGMMLTTSIRYIGLKQPIKLVRYE